MSSSSRLNLTPRFAETAPVFAVAPSPRAERGMGVRFGRKVVAEHCFR